MISKADGEIQFHFEKSEYFRVVHVDGAFGGISPGGATKNIHLAVFSERSPLPQRIVHRVSDGVLGDEIPERRETKDGIFREVEADLVMSIDVAIAVRDWLTGRIEEAREATQLSSGGQR